jgi:multidrug efflux system membrane fusion protein
MTAPDRRFEGIVDSIGWGVTPLPEDPFPGLPIVQRELDWVRLAQKFPVKIRLPEDVPPELLRVGTSASVVVRTGNP